MPIACAITPSPNSARPMDVHSCSSSEARAAALGRPLGPRRLFLFPSWNPRDQFRIVELAGCNLSPALGEAVMAKILHETLLLSCMAAFAIGLVLPSVFG
jgi:hypothetical protein